MDFRNSSTLPTTVTAIAFLKSLILLDLLSIRIAPLLLAIILEFTGVPPLAFALGMYLPLYLNSPLLAGGLIAYFVSKSSKDEKIATKRKEKGTLIASGFIAGGALMGVLIAFITFIGRKAFGLDEQWNLIKQLGMESWQNGEITILGFLNSNIVSIIMFGLLLFYLYWDSKRISTDDLRIDTLITIKGLSVDKANALIKQYGSIMEIGEQTEKELQEMDGIGKTLARRILNVLHSEEKVKI